MSDDIIRKMCRAHLDASAGLEYPVDNVELTAMRAALMVLADGVTDEMVECISYEDAKAYWRGNLSAAIRKAAE